MPTDRPDAGNAAIKAVGSPISGKKCTIVGTPEIGADGSDSVAL